MNSSGKESQSNWPFPSCLVPLSQSESWCIAFHMKTSFPSHADKRFCTRPRFEKEAQNNSEMSYSVLPATQSLTNSPQSSWLAGGSAEIHRMKREKIRSAVDFALFGVQNVTKIGKNSTYSCECAQMYLKSRH